jgi:hypothetical protein
MKNCLETIGARAEIVKYDVQVNQLVNVVLLCVAASNHEGIVRLHQGDGGGWSLASLLGASMLTCHALAHASMEG